MSVSVDKRNEFWDYLLAEKIGRPVGVTPKRLEKVKDVVLANDFLWNDVVLRHGGEGTSPNEFYASDSYNAQHSRSNFWSMVRETVFREIGK